MTERPDLLKTPLFWAVWYHELLGTEDREPAEFMQPFFGLLSQRRPSASEPKGQVQSLAGLSPRVRLHAPRQRLGPRPREW